MLSLLRGFGRSTLALIALGLASSPYAIAGEKEKEKEKLSALSKIDVVEKSKDISVTVIGTRAPDFTSFTMSNPFRVVVDWAGSRIDGAPIEQKFPKGLIRTVRTKQYDSEAERISRVTIELSRETNYHVEASGTKVTVHFDPVPDPIPEPAVKPEPVAKKEEPKELVYVPEGPLTEPDLPVPANPPPPPVVAKVEPKVEPKKIEPKPEPVIAKVEPKEEPKKVEPVIAKVEPAPKKADRTSVLPREPDAVIGKAEPKVEPKKVEPKPEPVIAKVEPKKADRTSVIPREPEAVSGKEEPKVEPKKAEPKPEPVIAKVEPVKKVEPKVEPKKIEPKSEVIAKAETKKVEPAKKVDDEPKAIASYVPKSATKDAVVQSPQPTSVRETPPRRTRQIASRAWRPPGAGRVRGLRVVRYGVGQEEIQPDGETPVDPEEPASSSSGGGDNDADPGPRLMKYIGFRQMADVSRVFVRLDGKAKFKQRREGDTVVVELLDTSVPVKNNTRPLDTSYFNSPVGNIQAVPSGASTRIEIKLKEQVPFTVKRIGTTIAIDFTRK